MVESAIIVIIVVTFDHNHYRLYVIDEIAIVITHEILTEIHNAPSVTHAQSNIHTIPELPKHN